MPAPGRYPPLFPHLPNQRLLIRFTALALSAGEEVHVASARARGEHAAVLDADPRELVDHRSDDTRCSVIPSVVEGPGWAVARQSCPPPAQVPRLRSG